MNKYRIQRIVFPKEERHMLCTDLFYKGDRGYLDRANMILTLGTGQVCDLTTYLNSCSWAKWKRYTCAEKLTLDLEIEGSYELRYIGYSKEFLDVARQEFDVITNGGKTREVISYEFPDNDNTVVGVEITAIDKCVIYGGQYMASYNSKLNDVDISLITTTCYKEEYIKKNVQLIKDELLDGEDEIRDHLTVRVIDNGNTLKPDEIVGEHVLLYPNLNTGGAGGFARGMLETFHHDKQSTHVLLMDDDVLLLPESIKRTYNLLRMLREEYREHFISGAMLKYERPYLQHEDVGTVRGGFFIPLKPEEELDDIRNVVRNEAAYSGGPNKYAAWWYCCIPVSVIRNNGLPLPLFIRGDDVEYSMRVGAKILTMNGICIWHRDFESRYNTVVDLYLQGRNMHVVTAVSKNMQDPHVHQDFVTEFYRKLYKFEYGACELILQCFEDYLKGPGFIENCDGATLVKEKRKYTEELLPLSENSEIPFRKIVDITEDSDRKFVDKVLFHITQNGHVKMPEFLYKKSGEITAVAYGAAILPQNITRKKEYAAIDYYSEKYVIRKIDKKRGKDLLKRFKRLEKEYLSRHETVDRAYRDAMPYLTSEEFWKKYLKLEQGE